MRQLHIAHVPVISVFLGAVPFINNQNFNGLEDGYSYSESHVQGLYLLGKFHEDCILKSLHAFGNLINATNGTNNGGLLLFYVIRNEGGILKVIDNFEAKQPPIFNYQVKQTLFFNERHPKKEDFLAVLIPEKEVTGYNENNTLYPVRIIAVNKNSSHSYKVWKYPLSRQGKLGKLKAEVQNAIKDKPWSNWETADAGTDFNVNIKIISKLSDRVLSLRVFAWGEGGGVKHTKNRMHAQYISPASILMQE